MLCGKGSLNSLILPLFKTKSVANSLRGLAYKLSKKNYEQKKRTRITSQATQTQLLLAADAFPAALGAMPGLLRTGLWRLAGFSC